MFNPAVNVVSFVFSAGTGLLFGYFPACPAASRDAMEALRQQ
ncbi:hypothetical protein [Polaromonas sp. CG9_12]|nr:hypothetical protein [Polaromonas sp. CG9_12]